MNKDKDEATQVDWIKVEQQLLENGVIEELSEAWLVWNNQPFDTNQHKPSS